MNIDNENSENLNIYEKSKGVIMEGDILSDVSAEIVKMNNSSANTIHAKNSAKLKQSAVKNIITQECAASQSAALKITSEKIRLSDTVVGLSNSKEAICDKTLNGISINETVHATTMNSVINYSEQIKAGQINAGILISREINGDVKTLLTTKSAAIMGLCFGFAFFILRAIFSKK